MWSGMEVNITEDARESPKVLIFKVGTIAPTINFNRNVVYSSVHVFADFEFCGCAASLAVAYLLAVYPQIECAVYTIEIYKDFFVLPISREFKTSTIGTDRIIVGRNVGSILWEGIFYICINCSSIAFNFPIGRNRYFCPIKCGVINFIKIFWTQGGRRRPIKFPASVQ